MPYNLELLRGEEEMRQADWVAIQALARVAIRSAIPPEVRSDDEVDAYVGSNDLARYIEARVDPQSEVGGVVWPYDGKQLSPNQELRNPRMVLAYKDSTLVGFATGADNVWAEDEAARRAKWRYPLVVRTKWFKLQEVIIAPEHQGKGLGPIIGRRLLKGINPLRPVSTFIYPDELPHAQLPLTKAGFTPPDAEITRTHVFGKNAKDAHQTRMTAQYAGSARLHSKLFSKRRANYFRKQGLEVYA